MSDFLEGNRLLSILNVSDSEIHDEGLAVILKALGKIDLEQRVIADAKEEEANAEMKEIENANKLY